MVCLIFGIPSNILAFLLQPKSNDRYAHTSIYWTIFGLLLLGWIPNYTICLILFPLWPLGFFLLNCLYTGFSISTVRCWRFRSSTMTNQNRFLSKSSDLIALFDEVAHSTDWNAKVCRCVSNAHIVQPLQHFQRRKSKMMLEDTKKKREENERKIKPATTTTTLRTHVPWNKKWRRRKAKTKEQQ